ncbi:aldehyde dehydrogenase family protein [Vulgatibacter incomptus]|uniref:Aldehyde dehydrogenase n=1 Tax=Vulgatibacter incomptus TaxID=1391653 RepID=A0A0K1PF63_9BACT|nr:aldehyde dehydrogenase family protein [Vulgatibacter incomptus]AKU91739.1 Aldehyde dehydrogenase [Vulgatibacter incomptus]
MEPLIRPAFARPSNLVDGAIRNTEPATGRPFPDLPITSPAEVREVVGRAREAQRRWAALDWGERRKKLLAFRDRLIARTDEVVDLLVRENGKARFEALTHEIFPIVDLTNFFAKRARRVLRDEKIPLHLFGPLKASRLRHEPRGVIGVISPWNFPFSIPMGDVIMALAARNAVVVKPSEWTPRILLLAKELLVEAGIDPDLVGVVPGGGETGAALVEADVDMVIFTGSVATGRKVGEACGRRLIPYVAELGGKDPAIVLPDANLDHAARQVVWGAFANSGQICASVERVLVHESIHDAFVAKVVELASAVRQGDPAAAGEAHVDVGAMVVPSQVDLVQRQLDDAKSKGARILVGGGVHGEGGARFIEPTVLVDVTSDMEIWRDETFGPCLPIRPYRDVEEAIREANDSAFGLSAYVFSRSVSRADAVARRLEAGTVMINDVLYTHALPETPWGGVKQSGIGRVHGIQGLKDLCEVRHVNRPRLPMVPLWMFPYRERTFRAFRYGMRKLFRGPLG